MKKFFAKNWFLFGILSALILGFVFHDAGVALNSRSIFSTILIVMLFLISGAKLPTDSIRSGLKTYKLHVFVQSFIFIVIPIYFFLTGRWFSDTLDGAVLIGFFALACLPTTISSCIVFTQSAEGNVVGTIFNAVVANVAGVFLSPLILSLLLGSSGNGLPLSELVGILQSLVLKMLIPIIVGQILRRYIKGWVDSNKKRLGIVSNSAILCILFFAFSKTAANPEFTSKISELALPFVYLAASHLVFLGVVWLGTRVLRFDRKDTVTALYTAPQKTLAMGVPLLTTFFGTNADLLGVALLPLVFYHAWQLLIAGVIMRFIEPSKKPA